MRGLDTRFELSKLDQCPKGHSTVDSPIILGFREPIFGQISFVHIEEENSCGVPISNPSKLNENLIGSFIGDTNQCPIECATQDKTPNNDLVGDSMVNVIAHEMSESVTDPLFTGWYDSDFSENGDLCLWNFGAAQGKTKLLPNGSYYNVKFGGHPWMIQQIWVNAHGGYCALALDE